MLAKLRSLAVLGIDAFEIGIEADTSEMLSGLTIVGLPDSAVQNHVKESCQRSTAVSVPKPQNHHQYGTSGHEKEGSGLICQSLRPPYCTHLRSISLVPRGSVLR